MPFDPSPRNPAVVIGHERLRRLSARLREEMPEGFIWDFTKVAEPIKPSLLQWVLRRPCGTVGCAYGLGMTLWPDDFPELEHDDQQTIAICAQNLGMGVGDFKRIFACLTDRDIGDNPAFAHYGVRNLDDVTPLMVAEAIDRYLDPGKP